MAEFFEVSETGDSEANKYEINKKVHVQISKCNCAPQERVRRALDCSR